MKTALLFLLSTVLFGQTTIQQNYDVRAYQFTLTNGSGVSGDLTSSGAGKVLTFTRGPKGIKYTASYATRLYISGGTGTAEAALITATTCGIAGGSACTVTVTTSNTHSGAWTVQSASGGMTEAANSASNGGVILVPASITAYATTTLPASLTLQCLSGATVTWGGGASPMVVIAAGSVAVNGCTLVGSSTATYGIQVSGDRSYLWIENNKISGMATDGYQQSTGAHVFIRNNSVSGNANFGINVGPRSGTLEHIDISSNDVDQSGCTVLNCGGIASWAPHTSIVGNRVKMGGNRDQGILWLDDPGDGLTDGVIVGNEVVITANGATAFECYGIASATNFIIANNVCKASVTVSSVGFYGYEINQCGKGTVSGNVFDGGIPTAPTTGITLLSASNVAVTGNHLSGWGANAGSHGFSMVHTDTANAASGQLSNNVFSGNTLAQSVAGATNADVRFETLTTGTVANNSINTNSIKGIATAGHICVKITNSGGATITNTRVSGNSIASCDVGIEYANGTGGWLDSNRITDVTTLYSDLATTTKIIDRNGIPFASLGSQGNGSDIYCTNCTIASPCNSGGSGAFAKRLNGAWVCN